MAEALTMRILHLVDRLTDRGGAYAWTLGVVDGLAATQQQSIVAGEADGRIRPPCPVDVLPGLASRLPRTVDLEAVARDVQVVHLHNITNPSVLEWAAGRGRALLTVQDHRFFCPSRGKWTASGEVCRRALSRDLCDECFTDADYSAEVQSLTERRLAAARRLKITVLSRYMREELAAAGVAAQRVHVVPPFVHDLPGAEPGPGQAPPCVLFVGRLVEAKGVREAVAAWRSSGVALPLILAGTGPLRSELERLAEQTADPARLEVAGWVGRRELAQLYRRARAVLFPPRWQEPFGIVGIEAQAFGVPVVAWESGGIAEWHRGPGLVPWGDVPALARALSLAVARRIVRPPRYERDEALGRLLVLYARLAEG